METVSGIVYYVASRLASNTGVSIPLPCLEVWSWQLVGRSGTHRFPSSNATVTYTVYPKKYAHGFVVLCFVVVMQSFIMNSYEVFIHIHQGCFAGIWAIVRLPKCQWSKPDGYGKISQCITTTKHSKAKTVCIFLGIYCILGNMIEVKWPPNWFAISFCTISIYCIERNVMYVSDIIYSIMHVMLMRHEYLAIKKRCARLSIYFLLH